ncbi:MAG: hypothetical protein AB7U20_21985 [Planctomycetaceae bacterium]
MSDADFQSIRALLVRSLVLGLLVLTIGCRPNAQSPEALTASAENVELPWADQIRAVRQGETAEIHMVAPITAESWSELAGGCEQLTAIDVERLEAPESALAVLSGLPQIRRLRIGSPVGDVGLRAIARIGSLEVLNLPQGGFTDAGLAELTALPRLELLRFHSSHVTDEGMQHVSQMPALRFLHLINVPITDAGLTFLHGLKHLESFYLDGGRCTDDGLSRLLHELPELHFHLNQLHLPDDPHAHPH